MLRRLVRYLLGTLRIEVTGGDIERFLNGCLEEGILLWDLRRTPERLHATMMLADFFQLRPVARAGRCRVRIRARHGLPFLTRRLRRRPFLLAGALGGLAALVWAGSHLWVVDVRINGPGYLDPRAILAVAAEAGLRQGAWKARIDLDHVTQHLKSRVEELSWAVVRVDGTRAVIEVVEKGAVTPPDQAQCVHLVARKAGVVEQVIPLQGEPLVKKGDVVQPGEMLVECALRYWAGGRPVVIPGTPPPPRTDLARTVVAQAAVKARVAYRQYYEYPAVEQVKEPTGRRHVQWVLNWNGRSIILRGRGPVPFAEYEVTTRTLAPGQWRNWSPPVEIVIREALEVSTRAEPVPVEVLTERARAAMERRLAWILGPNDRLLTPLRAEVVQQDGGYVGILVTVETLEEVSAPLEGPMLTMGR
ncbi:sporulation protein YqfD [Symbiobacterium thermophilum]|uniref:Sporulation protein YqfD n=1 Tax=Symbiobacterium thermophilum TaxID=2734 RepID=A0A953LIQ9_SYMTR|nr:sporulation protein YqfD [Symbiobacterium thermophilum]MBY6276334.1 sporulation protein YqfD [Symbiobacterium thermophilum]